MALISRYPASMRLIHWATATAILGAYGLTYAEALFARGTPGRAWVWWLHISIGLLVLLLLLVRIAARNMSAMPAPSTALTPLTHTASHAVHIALYILLLAVPVVGIGLAFLRGNDVSFFGLFSIPSPIAVDRTTAGEVQEVHEWLANALIAIAVLHACAALWHHFVKKDDILARMLPGRA